MVFPQSVLYYTHAYGSKEGNKGKKEGGEEGEEKKEQIQNPLPTIHINLEGD